ncbi:hypothetical protein PHMEG_00040157 [Phytophthora megakarya]|uniref:DDE Tnp4 domain-containing protein n=1 Tax=Phytophthora megakarya TaxID=4795 RepID=A0A225UED7_9STRA|nr:hypothetical protein PHMEG_00040157 [Phytophthora megakarya]
MSWRTLHGDELKRDHCEMERTARQKKKMTARVLPEEIMSVTETVQRIVVLGGRPPRSKLERQQMQSGSQRCPLHDTMNTQSYIPARVFKIKCSTFEKMITKFLNVLSPCLYGLYVEPLTDIYTMEKLEQTGNQFSNFPCARYATDVIFQASNMPSGTQVERNQFYSAIHNLHGYKVEVSVLPNDRAINCTKPFRGRKSDIGIFRDNIEFHQVQLPKLPTEQIIPDNAPLASDRPDEWDVLTDKGYQGLSEVIRAIHPEKKKPGQHLTRNSVVRNCRISSDHIIVENFFGRLVNL